MREKNAFRLLVRKPEGKRPLGRTRLRSVDNIKMSLGEIGWGAVGSIGLARGRGQVESSCECGNEFSDSIKCW
jgi:hypothetical protein